MRAARELAAPLVQGECRPIVFAEKRPKTGKGGKAFKSLTAAVKAAEREKEEARALKVSMEEALSLALHKLREAHGRADAFLGFIRRWCIIFVVLLLLNAVVGVASLLDLL